MTMCAPAAGAATTLRQRALHVLCLRNPEDKAAQARMLFADAQAGLDLGRDETLTPLPGLPGRPERPVLVPPGQVPRRSPHTEHGRAALLHAIAHIEFNAINLALDAVWRFAGLPEAYYRDWLQVAGEEALHFTLLRQHLNHLGHDYGDFEAHDGLWAMADKTREDLVARMALVPRTLEARGLDATPLIQAKLRKAGDARAVEILQIILRDEVGHVAIGNHWYRWLCQRQGLDPVAHYEVLARRYDAPRPKPPFNHAARRRAGFTQAELDWLERPL
ncbi:ferritin-like domain-containing protein [Caldimonas sp.]|uniref:ferritin-like domain-containing protein n=1 Tax=Caldimonas sp. TaxID=2838790 RepID=UPI00307DD2EC